MKGHLGKKSYVKVKPRITFIAMKWRNIGEKLEWISRGWCSLFVANIGDLLTVEAKYGGY